MGYFYHIFPTSKQKRDFACYLPRGYADSDKKWPLILFLHGAGERGNNISAIEIHGLPKLIVRDNRHFPFVIVSPQCPADDVWNSETQMNFLSDLLDYSISQYAIDVKRIYVTGLSMGGAATWKLALKFPHRFAAIAPICGFSQPEAIARIAHLPVWVFHGARDTIVPVDKSDILVSSLKNAHGNVRYTRYPDAGHDSWTETYENKELYAWFLKHSNQRIEK